MHIRTQILLLILIGILVYVNVLPNGFIDDDFFQIVNNVQVKSLSSVPQFFSGSTYFREETGQSYGLYFRPLMLSMYTVLYYLFGSDSFWFHVFQVIVH